MSEQAVPSIILHPTGPIADGPTRLGRGGKGLSPIIGLDCSAHPDIEDAFQHGIELFWETHWWAFTNGLVLAVSTDGPPRVTFGVAFDAIMHRGLLEQACTAGGVIGLSSAPIEKDPSTGRFRRRVVGVQFDVAGLGEARRLIGGNP